MVMTVGWFGPLPRRATLEDQGGQIEGQECRRMMDTLSKVDQIDLYGFSVGLCGFIVDIVIYFIE